MQAAVRPYVMAGVALAGAGLIVVTPVAPPPDLHRVVNAAVRLADASTDLLGGLANIPVNLFEDFVNIPYSESLALQEYASALGPAGNLWGVPGWIPPGAEGVPGAVAPTADGPVYALGGTGSYWYESLGNTWGWDDGNFPQLDGIISALLPFPSFTQPLVDQIQTVAQAEIIDGAHVDCEFECANWLGYIGGWFHTPITELLSPDYRFPTTLEDTVGQNVGDVINVANPHTGLPPDVMTDVVWSDQPGQLNPLAPFESFANSLTATPTGIEIPNITDVITNAGLLYNDIAYDFNPFETGSFLYWGAPTLYSVPAVIAGMVQTFTGVPNEFANTAIGWPPLGAEPVSGYTAGPASLLTGLPEGFEYFVRGLLGYLDPSIYLTALSNDASTLAGSADVSTVGLGSLGDTSALLGSLDPGSLVGDLSALLPSTVANLVPDLALQLLTSF